MVLCCVLTKLIARDMYVCAEQMCDSDSGHV